MKWMYLTLRSITVAQRGQRLLEQAGIESKLVRAPGWMEKRGCGYALKLNWEDGDQAADLLTAGEIPWLRKYGLDPQGRGRAL